ncbi:hypothetical protein ACIBCO_02520 [Streptomyces violascens]|uniref:hypothetical protein n=1 Tax=Streptomyces violascens TaxID=67381 RepID=UPI0037ADA6D1
MNVKNRTTAWIASALTLGVVAVGCATDTTDDAALEAVRTTRCPDAPPAFKASDGSDHGSLEPLAANRLLLCGYPPPNLNTRGMTSRQALVTDKSVLDRLRASLNRLGEPPSGPVNCPADKKAKVLEIFSDGHHAVELVAKLTGCQEVTNGHRDGWVGNSDANTIVMGLLSPGFCRGVWRATDCGQGAAAP